MLIISAGVLVYYKLDNISFGHLFCFANGPLHRMDLFHLANLKCTLYLASMVIVCRTFSTDPGGQSYQVMSNFFPQIAFISSRIRCRREYPHIPPLPIGFRLRQCTFAHYHHAHQDETSRDSELMLSVYSRRLVLKVINGSSDIQAAASYSRFEIIF